MIQHSPTPPQRPVSQLAVGGLFLASMALLIAGLAIAGVIGGITVFILIAALGAVPAAVLSHWGHWRIRRSSGAIGGNKLAATGAAIAYLAMGASALGVVLA